ncbi:MAG: hypothetical protein ABJC88_16815 [Parasphingorhabdus sp.]|uniref:hypothetical protein n=1 Tax=Sphingomonadales TaxID=204457 RepID=UPI003267B504
MTDTKIADWAKQRVCELTNEQIGNKLWILTDVDAEPAAVAFAKYIEQHEEKPIDPLLKEAREIAALVVLYVGREDLVEEYKGGDYDEDSEITEIIKKLRAIQKGGAA